MRCLLTIALVTVLAPLACAGPVAAQSGGDRPDGDRISSGPIDVARGESVSGNVVSFGGPVRVRGRVAGDVVALGGPATVSGRVAGDVIALGGGAALEPGAVVGGDVISPGGAARIGAGARVGGDVAAPVDAARIGAGASVGGDVFYGDEAPDVSPAAKVGGTVQRADVGPLRPAFGLVGLAAPGARAVSFLGSWGIGSAISLGLGLLLLWLGAPAARAAYEAARSETGDMIVAGLALVFGVPALIVLGFVTVVGIPLAFVLLLAFGPLLALGYAAGAWLLGRTLVGPHHSRYLALLAGWAVLRVLALVPVASWLAGGVATVLGGGALALVAWRSRHSPSARLPAGG